LRLPVASGNLTFDVVYHDDSVELVVTATPIVRCPGDTDADGIADIVLVLPNGTARVKNLRGDSLADFAFNEVPHVVDVELVSDIGSKGVAQLVALGAEPITGELRDLLTENRVAVTRFDPDGVPFDLELLDDETGNGSPELAYLGRGSGRVEVRDSVTGQLVSRVLFSDYLNAKDLEIYPDVNGNGSPELAVLGDSKELTRQDRIEVRDLHSGGVVRTIWLGHGWQVFQQALVRDFNENGSKEVAVLRVKDGGDSVNVMFRDSRSGENLGSIGFDRNYPPRRLLTVSDLNGNGSDEVVVFGRRFNGANQKVQIKDSKTKALIRAVFFDRSVVGQDIATCADMNGNGAEELVMLGSRVRDGKPRAVVKDSRTGELLAVVNF
jgi:hypothetical protein